MIVGETLSVGEKGRPGIPCWILEISTFDGCYLFSLSGKKIPGWNPGHIPRTGKEWLGLCHLESEEQCLALFIIQLLSGPWVHNKPPFCIVIPSTSLNPRSYPETPHLERQREETRNCHASLYPTANPSPLLPIGFLLLLLLPPHSRYESLKDHTWGRR